MEAEETRPADNLMKNRNRIITFAIMLMSVFIVSSAVFVITGDFFKNKSYDFLIRYIGGKSPAPHPDVMLLLIDENSLKYGERLGLGRWPWGRNIYPEILQYINLTNPPKAILFDIFFVESDRQKGNDDLFAEAIAGSGNIIQNMIFFENSERKTPLKLPPDVIKNFTTSVKGKENITFIRPTANEFSLPVPCLRSGVPCGIFDEDVKDGGIRPIAYNLSVASFEPDSDGVYRYGRILFNYGDHYFPSFSLSAVMAYTGKKEIEVLRDNVIMVDKYRIPVDDKGMYLVNYYNKNRVPAYSMSSLMESALIYVKNQDKPDKEKENIPLKPEIFKDKLVIIGCSAPGCQDLKNTPIHKTTPGPEIHANIISNMLQGNWIVSEKNAVTYIITFVIMLLSIFFVLFLRANIMKVLGLIGIYVIYTSLNVFLFRNYNYLAPLLFVVTSGLLSGVVSFVYLSMTEGAEKRKYSKILGNMIDPTIVSEAIKDLESLKKGGEKNITAFFSDIASFSTISEKLSSAMLANLLNEYLSAMTIILKKQGGTLDKYIGDAVVGIFGAPIDNPDNAMQAARASLEMTAKLAELREKWTQENSYCREAQEMKARIGINTGKAKVGFMGTENLASYTMMGDTVNLAARLEAAGKDYGVSIMVSDMTRVHIEKEMFVRKLDAVRVKGKEEPVLVYELIGYRDKIDPKIIESARMYENAFDLYTAMKWDEAIESFKKSRDIKNMPDKAVDMLIDRCVLYKKEPPEAGWDGVFTRTHK